MGHISRSGGQGLAGAYVGRKGVKGAKNRGKGKKGESAKKSTPRTRERNNFGKRGDFRNQFAAKGKGGGKANGTHEERKRGSRQRLLNNSGTATGRTMIDRNVRPLGGEEES